MVVVQIAEVHAVAIDVYANVNYLWWKGCGSCREPKAGPIR